MKKSLVFVLAALLVVVFTVPASAEFENVFGGYWRTRAWIQKNWNGDERDQENDYNLVDTRTRLFYTAKFSDDFRFVNQFEWDATWGDNSLGDIGADGKDFEIKRSYVDFNAGQTRWTVGIQSYTLGRGFIFSDDFSGVVARWNLNEQIAIPFYMVRISDNDAAKSVQGGGGPDALGGGAFTGDWGPFGGLGSGGIPTTFYANGDAKVDLYGINPVFRVGDNMTFVVPITYYNTGGGQQADNDWYYIGVDFDYKSDALGVWATGIYNGGEVDSRTFGLPQSADNPKVKGYLLAAGLTGSIGSTAWWAQGWYATGQDPNENPATNDIDAFVPIGLPGGVGSSWYWSEIMGLGIFDNQASAGSPGDHITNHMALGIGATWALSDKLKLKTDLWYASLIEPWVVGGEKPLGTEIDVNLIINIVENLNLELVGAYLAAGDATISRSVYESTTPPTNNQDNPWLLGTRLSFSF